MASIRKTLNSEQGAIDWCRELLIFWKENKYIQVTASDKRSLDANAAIRVCYKQIGEHRQDLTVKDVERLCKWTYGVPILRRDCVMHDHIFGQLEKVYDYERLLKIMDAFKVTSDMSTTQANEMIECMMLDFPFVVIEKPSDS